MADIQNPTSYKFQPAPNPAVTGYKALLKLAVDGTLVTSTDTDLAHLPPLGADGFYTIPFDTLKAQAVAAGQSNVSLTLGVEADYPNSEESVEVQAADHVVFVQLDPPSNVTVVQ